MDQQFEDCIEGKSVIIWGARIVGLGLSRKCIKDGYEILGFIDSDNSLAGKYINDIRVNQPSDLRKILNKNKSKKVAVIIAVSIKESEIKSILEREMQDYSDIDVYYYKDFNNLHYHIDVVSSCNLSCLSCAHSMEGPKPGGMMSLENVKEII